jgi:hypothetical protein
MSAATTFFPCTWGRIKLWASSLSSESSRRLVVHELSSGDEHPVSDHGMAVRRVRAELLFDDFDDDTREPIARVRELEAAVELGKEQLFTHPLGRSFMATVGEFTWDLDEDSNVRNARIEFVPTAAVEPVSPASAGTGAALGESSVTQAASELDAALVDVDLSAPVTARAVSAVESWSATEEVPTRQVYNETAGIASEIDTLVDEQGLEDDIELFEAWRAATMLGDAMRTAAIAATSSPATYVVRLTEPVPLLPLMAQLYGGAEAEERARQASELNDIRTPGWLPPGAYTLPRRTVGVRTRF